MKELDYAGFWLRCGASLIDTILLLFIMMPALTLIHGVDYWLTGPKSIGFSDVIINCILPAIAVVFFWIYKSATPGKIFLKLRIVDIKTGENASTAQLIGRYFGYFLSIIPLMLGII